MNPTPYQKLASLIEELNWHIDGEGGMCLAGTTLLIDIPYDEDGDECERYVFKLDPFETKRVIL